MKKFLFVAFAVCLSITATAQGKNAIIERPVTPQAPQEERYFLSLTVPQINAMYNGLRSSTGSFQDISFLLQEMDRQIQLQLDAKAGANPPRRDSTNAKPQTKKP